MVTMVATIFSPKTGSWASGPWLSQHQPYCPLYKLPLISRMTYTLLCGPQALPENECGHGKGSRDGAEHS